MNLWPSAPEIFGSLTAIDGTLGWSAVLTGGVVLGLSFAGMLAMTRMPSRLPPNLRDLAARVAAKAELGRVATTSLHDVVFGNRGESLKIDHLVKAGGGAVVVGSAALDGEVQGSIRDTVWTVRNGRESVTIPNPMIQVARRVHALRGTTHGALPLAGLVLYKGDARFETGAPEGLVPVAAAGGAIAELAQAMPSDGVRNRAWAALCASLLGTDQRSKPAPAAAEVVRLKVTKNTSGGRTGRSGEVHAFPGRFLSRA